MRDTGGPDCWGTKERIGASSSHPPEAGGRLAVPLVALCIITSLEVRALGGEVDEVTAQAALARAAVGPNGLINHLQDERTWAAVELVGSNSLGVTAPVESYEETRQATDEAVRELREQIRGAGPVAAAAFGPALENLADLAPLRAEIDDNRATSPVVGTSDNNGFAEGMYDRYIAMIRPLFDATDQVSLTIADDRLRRGAQLVNTTSRNIELFVDMARRHLIVGSLGGGIDDRSEIQEAAHAKSLWDHNNGLITSAEAPYDTVVAEHFPAEFVASFTAMVERAIGGEVVPTDELIAPLTTDDWGGLRELRSEAARGGERDGRRHRGPGPHAGAAVPGPGGRRPDGRPRAHVAGVPVHNPAAPVAHRPGQAAGRRPAAPGGDRGAGDTAG